MIGMDVRNIYVNPDDRSVFQQEMEQKGSVRDYEVKFRKKDGTQMDCLLTSSTWQGNGGRILGYQGIIRDITKQKQLEARVRQTQKMEAIGTLAGGIASLCLLQVTRRWHFMMPLSQVRYGPG